MMGKGQRNVDMCRKKMRRRIPPIWTCLNLITILLLGNSVVLAQTTIRYNEFTYETSNLDLVVTEDPAFLSSSNEDVSSSSPLEITTGPVSSTEKTNNAIPDALIENIKKRVMKKIEPDKNKPTFDDKVESTADDIDKVIPGSEKSSQPEFIPLNDTTGSKISEFETSTENLGETELDISTIDYSSSDFSGVISSDSDAVTRNDNNLPIQHTTNDDSSNVNLTSSSNPNQVRKISTLQKDFYSEETTATANTYFINQNQSSNTPIKHNQNNSLHPENNTVSYKFSTDKFESSPNMLTFITTTTPATTVPMPPKTKSITEDSTMNSLEKSIHVGGDTSSTKRQLKTTTSKETLLTEIIDNKNQLTTVATVTAAETTTSNLLNFKMLTKPEPVTTVTNTVTNASIEVSKTLSSSIETTKNNELESKETTITTMSTPVEKVQTITNTTVGSTSAPSTMVDKTRIRTTFTSTTASTTTESETVPTRSTVPTTEMILTPVFTVTTTAINKITTPSTKMTPSVVTISKTQSSDSTWQVEKVSESTSATNAIPPRTSTTSITIFVQLIIKGTWEDICSKLSLLKRLLAELINKNINNANPLNQVSIHQSRCSVSTTPTSLDMKNPLTSVLIYVINENGSYNETLTRLIPELYNKEPIDFTPTIQSVKLIEETDSENSIVVILVASITFICIVLLAGLVFIMKKRQSRFNYGERCRPVSLDAYSLDSVSAYNSIRRNKAVLRSSKRSYGNPSFDDSSSMPTHPLNFARLTSFCNESNAIVEEFGTIPQVSSKIDELPVGAELKNRYANVIPLPETRVYLQSINNDPTTEYINASYVRGPKNSDKFYIASQAPTENTVNDFWRMIWEQQCKVIIMLTDLVENGVEKCTEYVPPLEVSDCHRLYGDYQVTLKKREAKDKYAISTLLLKNLEKNVYREVWHIWYLWPTKGVPNDPAGLVSVLLEARAIQRGSTAPILIHCSPGTGRTGTVIAIDLLIRQYEITRTVDVPRIVYSIRRDRAGAVQTREQYSFIYKALSFYADKLTGGAIEST